MWLMESKSGTENMEHALGGGGTRLNDIRGQELHGEKILK
jgi:hypothetical protein